MCGVRGLYEPRQLVRRKRCPDCAYTVELGRKAAQAQTRSVQRRSEGRLCTRCGARFYQRPKDGRPFERCSRCRK